jgi:hypothetical protein
MGSADTDIAVAASVEVPASIEGKSPKQLAWMRFRRDRFAMVAAGIIVFYIF